MNVELIKKHWITGLGVSFIFLGFLYFLQQAIQSGWLPAEVRVALGLVTGSSLLAAGLHAFQHGRQPIDEVLGGLGAAVCYATFTYASFLAPPIVPASTLLIGTLVLSGGITLAALHANKRILASLALAGGLCAPIVLRAPGDLIFLLFLFATILNIASLVIATIKGWQELKLVTFVTTFVLYSVYWFAYRPADPGEPLFYIFVFFLVYFCGLLLGSLQTDRNFNGFGLYLNFLNCASFLFWSMFLLAGAGVNNALPLILVGLLYLLASFLIGFFGRDSRGAVFAYFLTGLIVLAISTGHMRNFFATPGIQYCLNAALWGGIAFALYLRGTFGRILIAAYAGIFAWFLTLVYWFAHAWDVEWVAWFGVKYIPFINPGALVWMALAAIGFFMAKTLARYPADLENPGDRIGADPRHTNEGMGIVLSLVAHGVLAGLLTIQLQNVWEAYAVSAFRLELLLSTAYTLHALLIFLWGSYVRVMLFRRVGSLLLGFIACKVLFFDLSTDPTMMKAVYLMTMGALIVGIGAVNARWKEEKEGGHNDEPPETNTKQPSTPGPGHQGAQAPKEDFI